MANMKEMARNALLIGGLLTAGGAAVDGVASGGFQKFLEEVGQRAQIKETLREKYGVEEFVCVSPAGGNCGIVVTVPTAKTSQERDIILQQYHEELNERHSQIPTDPRVVIDIAGVGVGVLAATRGAQDLLTKEKKR